MIRKSLAPTEDQDDEVSPSLPKCRSVLTPDHLQGAGRYSAYNYGKAVNVAAQQTIQNQTNNI